MLPEQDNPFDLSRILVDYNFQLRGYINNVQVYERPVDIDPNCYSVRKYSIKVEIAPQQNTLVMYDELTPLIGSPMVGFVRRATIPDSVKAANTLLQTIFYTSPHREV